jgi:hypothetical protein
MRNGVVSRALGRKTLLTVAVLLLVGGKCNGQGLPGYPDGVTGYDPREVRLLPPYCPHAQDFRAHVPGGSNSGEIEKWRAVLGPTFDHIHHYCWGLMKLNRAVLLLRGNPQLRNSYLGESNREFDYVITRAPVDFVLLPEILTKKAENLVRLGQGPSAIVEFSRAIEMKPDYWPPYAYMSDYYRQAGDKAKARELLEQGLAQAPAADALKRRLAEIAAGNSPRSAQ